MSTILLDFVVFLGYSFYIYGDMPKEVEWLIKISLWKLQIRLQL